MTTPEFTRTDVDTDLLGASFTVVGEIFPGEQNIVSVGYGALAGAYPAGGGTLQVYRPGADLSEWHKTMVFDADDDIVFPNQPTIVDVDSDGDNDIVIPYGYFFDTDPSNVDRPPMERGGIAWFENLGVDGTGEPLGFTRHDVTQGQPWSYHGVQYVDLDGDGHRDLISVGEQGKQSDNPMDDEVELQFFRGHADLGFDAPIALADAGGSLPVVADVDGDGLLDIVSSQYFDVGYGLGDAGRASFLWFENLNSAPGEPITADSFAAHTIATMYETDPSAGQSVGNGFQIRPVPDFRGDGKVAWIGTNHTNRCRPLPLLPSVPEAVFEFTPGDDIRAPWSRQVLSEAPLATPDCPADFMSEEQPLYPGGAITSRPRFGQAAPGVFGYGDIDGDGDIDLAVSGDGDHRLFWIEQKGDGSTQLHTLTGPEELFGQSGGAVVADLDGNGTNEMIFSSFDQNTVALWSYERADDPDPQPVTVTSDLAATAAKTRVRAGRSTRVAVTLSGLAGAGTRQASASFVPARTGRPVSLGTVALSEGASGRYTGTVSVPVSESGTVRLSYPGGTVGDDRDTAASAAITVIARSTVKGFGTGKKRVRAQRKMRVVARVSPGFKRAVRLQVRTCKGAAQACGWKTVTRKRTTAQGKVRLQLTARGKRSQWRVVAPGTTAGTRVVSGTRTLIRR